MQKGLDVLRNFRATLNRYQPKNLRVCGTEALRQARNSSIFLRQAEKILLQPIDIIDGGEEAHLSLTGALAGCKKPLSGPLLLVDVGGGSTELVSAESSAGESRVASVPLGVVGLTERFTGAMNPDLHRLDRLLAEILTAAFEKLNLFKKRPLLIIGCGGTATSMAALDLGLSAYNASLVHGHVLQSVSIEKLWQRLIALPAETRNGLPCLGDGRGEILPAGIRLYHVLLKLLQQDRMRVSDTGLLEGILLSSLPYAAP
jgi:exopolyphosphatase/guanosine-5'-triphosphate,3'-diphosphate pyrophosphatase